MLRHPSLQPLSRQHHHALALCVLVERALHEGSADTAQLARQIREHFERDLRPHFRLEEEILLPGLERELGPWDLCRRILDEHRELERRAASLGPSPQEDELRAFTALLRSHVRLEENELFEQIQARLSAPALESLGSALAAAGGPACPNRGISE